MSEFDTEYTDCPVCPYCGRADKDAWEIDFDGIDGDAESSCGSCGEDYSVSRHCILSYSTLAKARGD